MNFVDGFNKIYFNKVGFQKEESFLKIWVYFLLETIVENM